jgi:hypothetical protein
MRARLATLVRYLSNESPGLGMLAFIDDKSDDVATFVLEGLGHQSYSTTSDQAIRNARDKTWSPRASGRRCTRWACRGHGVARHREGDGRACVAQGRGRAGGWNRG